MKLSHLRHVVAVADSGSLHAAARQLKTTQPALTRSLRELERDLGAPLFRRHAKGVPVTELGQRFVQRAKAILSEVGHARDEISQLQGVMQGQVSACLGVLPHLTLLPEALKAFRARYPQVQLDIIEGRFPVVEPALRLGVIDLFVGPLPSEMGGEFAVEHLYDQDTAILCRKGHPLTGARSLRELAPAEWLTNSVTADPVDEIAPFFRKHGLPTPRHAVQSHSALTLLTVIGHSDLLSLLPADLARSDLGRTLLVRLNIAESPPVHPIVMIRRADVPLTPAAEYFADMMRRASVHFMRARTDEAGR
jgi:DNA-binding transcriptional LysR family regulator